MKKAIFAFVLFSTIALTDTVCAVPLFGSVGGNLYSVNSATGAANIIGSLGIVNVLGNLAGAGGNLFGSVGGNLYSVDSTTGAASIIGSLGVVNVLGNLAGDAEGNLFGSVGGNLYSVNSATGAANIIGSLGIVNVLGNLAALDPVKVSEPVNLAIFAFGIVGLSVLRRRQKAT